MNPVLNKFRLYNFYSHTHTLPFFQYIHFFSFNAQFTYISILLGFRFLSFMKIINIFLRKQILTYQEKDPSMVEVNPTFIWSSILQKWLLLTYFPDTNFRCLLRNTMIELATQICPTRKVFLYSIYLKRNLSLSISFLYIVNVSQSHISFKSSK